MRSLLIVFLIAIVLLAIARKPRPANNQNGSTIHAPEDWSVQPNYLKVASFNIQTGKSETGVRNISQSANLITDADIVGVQEVYAPSWLNKWGIGTSQAKFLASAGNFGQLFAATRWRWLRENRGNLLLSKLPVSKWRIVMLPDQSGNSFRNMTIAELSWQGEQFVLINTHLHTSNGREQQLDLVLKEFARHPRAILLGDFNTTRDDPLLTQALADGSIADAIASAGLDQGSSSRIDWILTKGFKVNSGRMIDKGVSDHPYYEVSLQLVSASD